MRECDQGCGGVFVEPHIPKSAQYTTFFGGCTWADDHEEIKPGDRVVITENFTTYYVMTVMP